MKLHEKEKRKRKEDKAKEKANPLLQNLSRLLSDDLRNNGEAKLLHHKFKEQEADIFSTDGSKIKSESSFPEEPRKLSMFEKISQKVKEKEKLEERKSDF